MSCEPSIYINSCFILFFFLLVISKVRNYTFQLLSPTVHVTQNPTSLLRPFLRQDNEFLYERYFSHRVSFQRFFWIYSGKKGITCIIQKNIPCYVKCIHINFTYLHLISMAEKCPILIYLHDSTMSIE